MSFHFLLAPDAFQYGSSLYHVRRTSDILLKISNWILTVFCFHFPSMWLRIPLLKGYHRQNGWNHYYSWRLRHIYLYWVPSHILWTRARWDVTIHLTLRCFLIKALCHLRKKLMSKSTPGIRLLVTYDETLCWISKSMQAMTKTKRNGDNGHPWRIPEACCLVLDEPKLSLTKNIGLE